ncbi:MAG TPA: GMC oxidoreductase [Mycobacteriales bacterium]
MSDDQHFDVIGTGAGGGTFAHRLASCGKRVLMLERRGYLPRERDNRDSTEVFVKGKYRASEFWYDHNGEEFPPEVNYYVGGNTKFYGAALFRLRPRDFGEVGHYGEISPAWPLGYCDFEAYYSEAEEPYLVHELDNLYMVDTSFFPSIGAVNPSLTAIANALRVGDHLVDRLS